jgi:hypothetical protein
MYRCRSDGVESDRLDRADVFHRDKVDRDKSRQYRDRIDKESVHRHKCHLVLLVGKETSETKTGDTVSRDRVRKDREFIKRVDKVNIDRVDKDTFKFVLIIYVAHSPLQPTD